MEDRAGERAPRRAAVNLQGVLCIGAILILLPLVAYTIGVVGLIVLYFVTMGGVGLLYAAQLLLTRQASLPQAEGGPPGAPFSLENRHVLITGGSKGIGKALAVESVKRGASLVTLVARDTAALREAQATCLENAESLGFAARVQVISADLSDPKEAIDCLDHAAALKDYKFLEDIFSHDIIGLNFENAPYSEGWTSNSLMRILCLLMQGELKESSAYKKKEEGASNTSSAIDVFFCNAAHVDPRPFVTASTSDITQSVALNVATPLLQVRHVLPGMTQRGFGIICFSNSLAAYVPIFGLAAYSASKNALRAFTEAINQEVAGMGVLVANAFLPSVNTPGYEREKKLRHRLTEILESASKLKQPEEVVESMVDHLEAGHRVVTVDFEGWVCARLNAGFSRAESFASLFFEFLLGGVFRLFFLGLFLQFYSIISREQPAALRKTKAA
ncbi:hypothetical protein ACSSS7_003667 [Eimeria intestinalis]